jgi:hypothetical protein
MSSQSLTEVYRAASVLDAKLMQASLESAEIPAVVTGELLQNALGDIPLGWSTAPRIMVPEKFVESARTVIEAVQAEALRNREEAADANDDSPSEAAPE